MHVPAYPNGTDVANVGRDHGHTTAIGALSYAWLCLLEGFLVRTNRAILAFAVSGPA